MWRGGVPTQLLTALRLAGRRGFKSIAERHLHLITEGDIERRERSSQLALQRNGQRPVGNGEECGHLHLLTDACGGRGATAATRTTNENCKIVGRAATQGSDLVLASRRERAAVEYRHPAGGSPDLRLIADYDARERV